MRVQWAIGEWGEACGPKPSAKGESGGFVSVEQTGGELSITGNARPFSTSNCWERYPGLSRVSHSGGVRSWRSVCKTAKTDSRQATVITTVTASDTTIRFDETGQYGYVIHGQDCAASSRRTRTYRLVERQSTEVIASADIKNDSALQAVTQLPRGAQVRCAKVGPVASLEVSPQSGWLHPGRTLDFRAVARDAAGCVVGRPNLTWRVEGNWPSAELSPAGVLTVAESTPHGELPIVVEAGKVRQTLSVQIVSEERYEALLAAPPSPALLEANGSEAVAAAVDSTPAVAEDRATRRKYWFAAIVALTAGVLGALGAIVMRQAKRMTRAPKVIPTTPSNDREPAVRKICPTCGSMYGSESEFCGKDGSFLVRAN
jgi:hypothetical protein